MARNHRIHRSLFIEELEARVAPAILTVNSLVDNTTPGDGLVTLREAIDAANTDGTTDLGQTGSGADGIVFDPALFPGSMQTITLTQGQLAITSELTVTGPGADKLTIDGNNTSRIFDVNDGDGGSQIAVQINGLTLANAKTATSGGAVANSENLGMGYCGLVGNDADFGGGIFNMMGTVTVENSTLSGNTALQGGGINNMMGTVLVFNSTISGNSATDSGGGIYNEGTLTIQNVTIFDNSATGDGGGIYNSFGTVTIESTIVAGNTVGGSGPDVFGSVSSQGHNLVGDGSGSGGFGAAGDQVGSPTSPIDPLLGALADNGGPTPTHALNAGSPAIDAGSNPRGLTYDQRGEPYLRVDNGQADIGAFEAQDVLPDLIGTRCIITDPEPGQPADEFDVEWEVTNVGNGPANPYWWVNFYASQDTVFGAEDQLLKGVHVTSALAPDESISGTLTLSLPDPPSAEWKYLLMVSDMDGDVTESDEYNNYRAELEQDYDDLLLPDLVGEKCIIKDPKPRSWGATFDLEWEVHNVGDAVAPPYWWLGFYVSEDGAYDAGDVELGGLQIETALDPCQTASGTITLGLPLPAPFDPEEGTFYIVMFSDDTGKVTESVETNNHSTGHQKDYDDFGIGQIVSIRSVIDTAFERTPPDDGIFRVSRVGDTSSPLTVYYTVTGTADNGVDYQQLPGSATIPAGSDSVDINVTPIVDDEREREETVVLRILPDGYEIGEPSGATVTILDDLPNLKAEIENRVPVMDWGESFPEFRGPRCQVWNPTYVDATPGFRAGVYLSEDTDLDFQDVLLTSYNFPGGLGAWRINRRFPVATLPSSAPDHFSRKAGRFYLLLYADDLGQVLESFEGDNVAYDDIWIGTVVEIFASDPVASETDRETGEFIIRRHGPNDSPLPVRYTISGSADSTDYSSNLSGTAVIPAWQDHVKITIKPNNDPDPEPDETVTLTLTPDEAYEIDPGRPSATVTIYDNDSARGGVQRSGVSHNGQVFVYDTDATNPGDVDVNPSDLDVKLNKDGSIKDVTIIGDHGGFGIIIDGGSVKDKRKSAPLSFLVVLGPSKAISVNSAVTGWDIGQLMVEEGFVDDPDLDGDGVADDLTSIYLGGPTKRVKVNGEVGGDVIVKGADPKKDLALGRLDVRKGDVLGDIVLLDGGAKFLGLRGGDFKGKLIVNGDMDKMSVNSGLDGAQVLVNGCLKGLSATQINNSLIAAAQVGKVTVKRNLTESVIHAGGSVDGDYQWIPGHGSVKGVTVGLDMVDSSVTAGVWLGDNLAWDHDVVGVDADTVCALPGSSVICKVNVKGTVTWSGRCGILSATDVLKVQARGNGWKLKSTDLPWPDSNYPANIGFLIDCAGRWL